jgi:hypothetical protein
MRDSPRSANSPAAGLLALIIFFPAGCAVSCRVTGRRGAVAVFAADDNHAERDFRRRRTIEMMKT